MAQEGFKVGQILRVIGADGLAGMGYPNFLVLSQGDST